MSLRPEIVLPQIVRSMSPPDLPPTDTYFTRLGTVACRTGPEASDTDLSCIDPSAPCPLSPCRLRHTPVTIPLTFADIVAHLQTHHAVELLPILTDGIDSPDGDVPREQQWTCVWPECSAVLAVSTGATDPDGDVSRDVLTHLWTHYSCEADCEDDYDRTYDYIYGCSYMQEQELGIASPPLTPTPSSTTPKPTLQPHKLGVCGPSTGVNMYPLDAEAMSLYAPAPAPVRGQAVDVYKLECAARSACRPALDSSSPPPPPPLSPLKPPIPPSEDLVLWGEGLLEALLATTDMVAPSSNADPDADAYLSTHAFTSDPGPDVNTSTVTLDADSDADANSVTCCLCGPHSQIPKDRTLILAHLQQNHHIDDAAYPHVLARSWKQWTCTWPCCSAEVHPAVGNIVKHVLWHMDVSYCDWVEPPPCTKSESGRAVTWVPKSYEGNVGLKDGAWGSWRRGSAVRW